MEAILLFGLFIADFSFSLLAYSLRECSRFKIGEYTEMLKQKTEGRNDFLEKRRDRILTYLEETDKPFLTFLLPAYLLDVVFIMVLFFSYSSTHLTFSYTGILWMLCIYVFSVYFFCRLFALNITEGRADAIVFGNFRLIRALSPILYPFSLITSLLNSVASKASHFGDNDEDNENGVEDDIKESITEGVEDGVLEEKEKKMIESVLKFDDSGVKEIMKPRTDIVSIDVESSIDQAVKIATESGYSRIPVYKDNIDDIVGILYVKDILEYSFSDMPEDMSIKDVMREAYFIPESKMVSELFREIREKKNHFAVVLDEYGGTAGIITAEDIIEEIVGEIEDEYDKHPEEKINRISELKAEVDARIDIGELNEIMGFSLPDSNEFESLGGFLAQETGKIPQKNEKVHYDDLEFRIIAATPRKIHKVEVTKLTKNKEEPEDEE